jgi:hypothetical protein
MLSSHTHSLTTSLWPHPHSVEIHEKGEPVTINIDACQSDRLNMNHQRIEQSILPSYRPMLWSALCKESTGLQICMGSSACRNQKSINLGRSREDPPSTWRILATQIDFPLDRCNLHWQLFNFRQNRLTSKKSRKDTKTSEVSKASAKLASLLHRST